MEITTPSGRVTEIFKLNDDYYTATVTIDETYAQVFKFTYEPTPEECDAEALKHIELVEKLKLERLAEIARLEKLNEELNVTIIS